ncbi:hypothetical protein D3C78_1056930 [compost metagenome]
MVVGLHLHQDVHRLLMGGVLVAARLREEAPGGEALDHRGVVLVGAQHAFAVQLVGVLDHAEQRLVLAFAVDVPAGIEDLVPAVLGVGLGEHHQLDVVGVAPQVAEALHQVVDLVLGQGQAQLDVGGLQRGATAAQHVDHGQRLGLGMAEQRLRLIHLRQNQLGHAVVQYRGDQLGLGRGQLAGHVVGDAALEALDLGQAAVAGDVAGLARPRRDGAEARHHQEQTALRLLHRDARTVLQQTGQHLFLVAVECAGDFGEMGKLGIQPGNRRDLLGQLLEQFAVTEGGKSGGAAQDQHCRNSLLGKGVRKTAHSSAKQPARHPQPSAVRPRSG